MTFEVLECSPQAEAFIKSKEDKLGVVVQRHVLTKYPFDQLHIGQSFKVPFGEDANEASIRVSAFQRGKKTGKAFKVLKHADSKCFEVARIA